jgi:hypothetical protein
MMMIHGKGLQAKIMITLKARARGNVKGNANDMCRRLRA